MKQSSLLDLLLALLNLCAVLILINLLAWPFMLSMSSSLFGHVDGGECARWGLGCKPFSTMEFLGDWWRPYVFGMATLLFIAMMNFAVSMYKRHFSSAIE